MTTATKTNTQSGSTLKDFEARIRAQVDEAKAKLAQLETKAKETRSQNETAAVNKLNTATQDIDRKLQDLKSTHETHVAHAKSEIEADVAKLKASIDDLGARFKTPRK